MLLDIEVEPRSNPSLFYVSANNDSHLGLVDSVLIRHSASHEAIACLGRSNGKKVIHFIKPLPIDLLSLLTEYVQKWNL